MCTDDAKAAWAQVSVACGLSVEILKLGIQTICTYLYHHYYQSIDDVKSDNDFTMTSAPSSTDASNKNPSTRKGSCFKIRIQIL